MVDRYRRRSAPPSLSPNPAPNVNLPPPPSAPPSPLTVTPSLLLLPGSRPGELRRHLPVLVEAARRIAAETPASLRMVLPTEALARSAGPLTATVPRLQVQVGGLAQALSQADLALTKSGTITLECAVFGVPAVVFYKTSATTYLAGRQIVKVKYLAMPNLLADEPLFPEFVQGAATAENLSRATLDLLRDEKRRAAIKARLAEIVGVLWARRAPVAAPPAPSRASSSPLAPRVFRGVNDVDAAEPASALGTHGSPALTVSMPLI